MDKDKNADAGNEANSRPVMKLGKEYGDRWLNGSFKFKLHPDHSSVRVQGEGEVLLCLDRSSGSERKVGVWDYDLLYKTPGLYHALYVDLLENASHLVAPEFLLEKRLELEGEGNPVRLLDVAAGSGLMGAELRRRAEERGVAVEKVVGLDSLESARDACFRENPGVYTRYHAKKISDMCGAEVRELLSEAFNCCLVGSAADVGDGAAVTAAQFVEVLQVLRPGGILVLNVREETTKSETMIVSLLRERCRFLGERSYVHRRMASREGKEIRYRVMALEKK